MGELQSDQELQQIEDSFEEQSDDEYKQNGASRLPRQLAALRHRNYRLFFSGQIISLTGTWLQQVAHGWLVYDLTNSARMLGIVGSISALPVLLFSLLAGVAADRFNKRNVLRVTQICLMILALTLATLVKTDVVTVYHVMIIGFLLGTVNSVDAPTRHSFLIEMVGRKDLMNAIALNSATFNSARIMGPALAGVIIAAVGISGAFYLNGISYIAVIIGLSLMTVRHIPASTHPSPLEGIKEGLHFIRSHSTVRSLLILAATVSIFAQPYAILMPIFARDILNVGPGGLGYLMSSVGAGALIGAIIISSLGDFPAKGRLLLTGNMTFCAILVLFSFSRLMPLSMLLLVGVGWGIMTNMAMTNTLIQTLVPDHLRGRVLSVYTLTVLGMAPFGTFQAGMVANALGAPWAVRIGVIVCVTMALVLSPWILRAGQPAAVTNEVSA